MTADGEFSWRKATEDLPEDLFGAVVLTMIASPDTGGLWSGGSSEYLGPYSHKDRRLMQVAFRMSKTHLEQYLKTRKPSDDFSVISTTLQLLPAMKMETRRRATEMIIGILSGLPEEHFEFGPPGREVVLATVAPILSQEQLTTCLDIARGNEDTLNRVLGLVGLLPFLIEPVRQQITESAKVDAQSIDPSDWRYALALATIVPVSSGDEQDATIVECLAHLRLGYVGNEEALAQLLPFLRPELLTAVSEWIQQSSQLTLLPDVIERLLPLLKEAEIRELYAHLGSYTISAPAISNYAHCLARLQVSNHLSETEAAPAVGTVMELIKNPQHSDLFNHDIYKRIVDCLDDRMVRGALDLALRYNRDYRLRALPALIPRLDELRREEVIRILVSDCLSLDGIKAMPMLDKAMKFFAESDDALRMVKRELVARLYVGRICGRSDVLHILGLSEIFSERVLSRSVLSQIGEHILDLCHGWSWM